MRFFILVWMSQQAASEIVGECLARCFRGEFQWKWAKVLGGFALAGRLGPQRGRRRALTTGAVNLNSGP
jgi:hypothetical protein